MIEQMKQWLEALEDVGVLTDREWQAVHKNKANELRQAIAELEKQEPVGYFKREGDVWFQYYEDYPVLSELTALYTHPQPKREPLTDEEIERIYNRYGGEMTNCARAIERAHGIKE